MPALAARQRARHQHILAPRAAAVGQDDQAAGVVLHKVLQPRRAALHEAGRGARPAGVHQVNLRQALMLGLIGVTTIMVQHKLGVRPC